MGWPLGHRHSICHSRHLHACSVASAVHLPGILSYTTTPKPTLPSLPYFSEDKIAHSRVKKKKMTSVIFTELLAPTPTWEVNPLVSSGSSVSIVITHRGVWLRVWYTEKKLDALVFQKSTCSKPKISKETRSNLFFQVGDHWTSALFFYT